jgi:hypothetical protein
MIRVTSSFAEVRKQARAIGLRGHDQKRGSHRWSGMLLGSQQMMMASDLTARCECLAALAGPAGTCLIALINPGD